MAAVTTDYQSLQDQTNREAISTPPFTRQNICPLTNQPFAQRILQAPLYLVAIVKLLNRDDAIFCDANALYKHFITEKKFEFPGRGNIAKNLCERVSFCALHSLEGRTAEAIKVDAELESRPVRNSFANTLLIACSHQNDEYARRARLQVIVHYFTNKNYDKAWVWSRILADTYPSNDIIRQFADKIETSKTLEKLTPENAIKRHIGSLRNHLRCKKITDIAKTLLPLVAGACLMIPIPESYKVAEIILQTSLTFGNISICPDQEIKRTRKVILTSSIGASLFDITSYIAHGLQTSILDITKVVGTSLSFIAATATLLHNHFKFRNILQYIESKPLEIREIDIV